MIAAETQASGCSRVWSGGGGRGRDSQELRWAPWDTTWAQPFPALALPFPGSQGQGEEGPHFEHVVPKQLIKSVSSVILSLFFPPLLDSEQKDAFSFCYRPRTEEHEEIAVRSPATLLCVSAVLLGSGGNGYSQ